MSFTRRSSLLCACMLFCLLMISVSALAAGNQTQPDTPPDRGDKTGEQKDAAPILEMDDYDAYIEANEGAPILVNFWATWCSPCLRELPGLRALRDEIPEDDLRMVLVSLDFDRNALLSFLEKTPQPFPCYHGHESVVSALKITGIPKTIIYSAKGDVVFNHDGYLAEKKLRSVLQEKLGW